MATLLCGKIRERVLKIATRLYTRVINASLIDLVARLHARAGKQPAGFDEISARTASVDRTRGRSSSEQFSEK